MTKFLIYESMKQKPDMITTRKELELYKVEFKIQFTYMEMVSKVEEIFANREASPPKPDKSFSF